MTLVLVVLVVSVVEGCMQVGTLGNSSVGGISARLEVSGADDRWVEMLPWTSAIVGFLSCEAGCGEETKAN